MSTAADPHHVLPASMRPARPRLHGVDVPGETELVSVPRALLAIGLCAGLTLAVALEPQPATFALWIGGVALLLVMLAGLAESLRVERDVLVHRTWRSTTQLRLSEIRCVERSDPDALVREVLVSDGAARTIAVPEHLLTSDEFHPVATRLAALDRAA
jgi:hypothetical protein